MIIRKSAQEIEKMAAAGRAVAETIAHVGEQIEPGISTGSPKYSSGPSPHAPAGLAPLRCSTRPPPSSHARLWGVS